MRLSIRLLMPRPRPAFRLYSGPKRRIFDVFKVNNPPRKITKTLGTMKRISVCKIFLLIHYQVGPNLFQYTPRKTRTVVFAKENPDDKAKARIRLPLASMPPPSGKIRTRIRIKKTYPTLSTTIVSRKVIMPTNVARRSQKTSVGLDVLYVGN